MVEVEADKTGRITIPASLREYAGLDRDVVVVGVDTRFEIWDAATWDGLRGRAGGRLRGHGERGDADAVLTPHAPPPADHRAPLPDEPTSPRLDRTRAASHFPPARRSTQAATAHDSATRPTAPAGRLLVPLPRRQAGPAGRRAATGRAPLRPTPHRAPPAPLRPTTRPARAAPHHPRPAGAAHRPAPRESTSMSSPEPSRARAARPRPPRPGHRAARPGAGRRRRRARRLHARAWPATR